MIPSYPCIARRLQPIHRRMHPVDTMKNLRLDTLPFKVLVLLDNTNEAEAMVAYHLVVCLLGMKAVPCIGAKGALPLLSVDVDAIEWLHA